MKLSNSKVTLNLLSNVIGDSIDETNIPHKLLVTDKQILRLRRAFAINSSGNIELSKIQFLLEICKLHIFAKSKACDLS